MAATRGSCPKCNSPLTVEELSPIPASCPVCNVELRVVLKAEWVYTALAVAVGAALAALQGAASIVFAFKTLMYTAVVLMLIKLNRWELHLPIKILPVPDYRLWH